MMKKTYSYNGYSPYGAGEMWILENYVDDDFKGNVTEKLIADGVITFTIIDDDSARVDFADGHMKNISFVKR